MFKFVNMRMKTYDFGILVPKLSSQLGQLLALIVLLMVR